MKLRRKLVRRKKESGKSSVLLDVKPWDDETKWQNSRNQFRVLPCLVFIGGASKLVAIRCGIKKAADHDDH